MGTRKLSLNFSSFDSLTNSLSERTCRVVPKCVFKQKRFIENFWLTQGPIRPSYESQPTHARHRWQQKQQLRQRAPIFPPSKPGTNTLCVLTSKSCLRLYGRDLRVTTPPVPSQSHSYTLASAISTHTHTACDTRWMESKLIFFLFTVQPFSGGDVGDDGDGVGWWHWLWALYGSSKDTLSFIAAFPKSRNDGTFQSKV